MAVNLESVSALPMKKVRRYLFLLLLLGLAVYFLLPRIAAMKHALLVVSTLRVSFVLLGLSAQILSYLGSGYLIRWVVNPRNEAVSIVDGALVTAAANSVGTLGGGVLGTAGMTYMYLRRRGIDSGAAGLGSWLPIYLNNAVLAVVSFAGLVVLTFLKKSSGLTAIGFTFVGLTLSLGAGLWWALSRREKVQPLVTAVAGFVAKLRRKSLDRTKLDASVGGVLKGWDALVEGGWRKPIAGAIMNTAFDMLTLSCLFFAAGLHVSPGVLIAGYGVPQLLGKLTVILGGVGIVESGMVGLYAVMGVPKSGAIVAVLGYRLFSFWLPTLSGIALVPYLGHEGATRGKTADPGS